MKHLILTSTLFLGAAMLSAQAQSIRATIPFDFEANGKTMPAGDYKVEKISDNSGGLFTMRAVESSDSVLLTSKIPIANSEGPVKFVFEMRADGYYLTQLWDGTMGRELAAPHGRSSVVASTKPATRVVIAHK